MASLSTSSTTSSTSSLGNTSLRGFGGIASGLDRDSFIDALTSTTSSKITKAKQKITTLQWQQEAYKSLSDKALDLQDNYTSYAGSKSIVNRASYLASTLTAGGDSVNAGFVKATGSSDLLSHIAIKSASLASSGHSLSGVLTDQSTSGTATSSTKLSDLGLTDEDFENGITINGTTISGLTKDSTIDDLVSKVNSSGAGVKAKFLSSSGKLALITNNTGADAKITIGDASGSDAAAKLFGGTGSENVAGTNGKMTVSYGNGVEDTIESSTNTFNVDGLKVTASNTFDNANVTFTKSADTSSILENVKSFIKDYNALVEEVNTHVTTRPSSDYEPLTEDQEDEMTESEIEKWNKKAKEGILYNETTVSDLAFSLQGFINTAISDLAKSGYTYTDLQNIGISMSEDYADGGQIKFDEDKFKAALESDPNKVADIMGGTSNSKGIASKLQDTLTPYATKYATRNHGSYGRLIEAAGSDKLSLSKTSNTLYKSIQEQNTTITDLKAQLKTEQERYIEQFSNLEKLINNMNTQASYLSGLSG